MNFRLLFAVLFLSGCATIATLELNKLYGESNPENRLTRPPATQAQQEFFHQNIKGIIENRCVVCHGCYDAPCQLKLESLAGLQRGANKTMVYDGERLLTANYNHSTSTSSKLNLKELQTLRSDGFFSVLNERDQTPLANKNVGLMYQMLQLKQQHPLPDTDLLNDSFDVSLNRSQQCPTIEEFPQYQQNNPLAGMPYALPALNKTQHQILTTWLENGAILPQAQPINASQTKIINQWEAWLNNSSNKQQLVSRYIYEHLYLANLYFKQSSNTYFKLVRSSTPSGQKVTIINSRRPFDNPFPETNTANKTEKAQQVYYRLVKNNDTIIAKRHMPYRFDLAKLAYLNALFITPSYQVNTLPDYQLINAANPFITFKAIPVKSRYTFLLEQAQFSIMNFIKGPVCRGQIALNVIQDHFWVFFADPENITEFHSEGFIDDNSDLLELPAGTSDKMLPLLYWNSYARNQQQYLKNKAIFFNKIGFTQSDLDLDLIWSGDANTNAALTIFRHFDSATVLQGFVGQTPKSAWFITYPILERIHYLLVAGFDVYGSVGHQLKTRLYMDFLRMEAETNFIALLPKKDRRSIYEFWYRDSHDAVKDYIFSDEFNQLPQSNIQYKTLNPKEELLTLVAQRTGNAKTNRYNLISSGHNHQNILQQLNNKTGTGVTVLPQISYVMVTSTQGEFFYTLINNSAHSNVAHLFAESDRRIPKEDSLTVVAGIIGTYPNAFFKVNELQLNDFVNAVELVQTEEDYRQLKDNYGIRRTNKYFWQYADKLHAWYKKNQTDSAGLLDFNRLENR